MEFRMPRLLVTTPHFLLGYCTQTRAVEIIETERKEYYGISWFRGDTTPYLSHSGINNELLSVEDYMQSERGYLSRGDDVSERFLSQPHQICCIEDGFIAATNTGRNCLSIVNRRDWSIRQIRFNEVLWDRLGSAHTGNHFNSVHYENGRLYVVAHNFTKGAFTIDLEWPSLKVIATTHHEVSGIHNLWIRDDGARLSCDTMNFGLVDLNSNRMVWKSEPNSLTRGLAATSNDIYVGSSNFATRKERVNSETGIWVVDAGTMRTKDYHWLGDMGGVHEIRIVDELDLCHPVGPLQSPLSYSGTPVAEYRTSQRLSAACSYGKWNLEYGKIRLEPDDSVVLDSNCRNLLLWANEDASDFSVSAHVSIADMNVENCAIVGRYAGPGDQNMIAAILTRQPTEGAGLGIWINRNDQWTCLFAHQLNVLSADVKLRVKNHVATLFLGDAELATVSIQSAGLASGKVGIRGTGGTVSNFEFSDSAA